ncbi:hypothetical protein PENSUB_8160 [Penicillium subrubescens]|uniref:FAD-binding domain-containing protein n=1 Tax=Penicillium subrubescens TaxID=1316194 RepID=A0A1Q5TI98_9EURO|nr:hypothetical protein PENSUB_8160 [Penicillium subrubescens]
MVDSGPVPMTSNAGDMSSPVPVLIVGGGPICLLRALLLSRLNVRLQPIDVSYVNELSAAQIRRCWTCAA